MTNLVEGALGSAAKYDVKFENGKLTAEISADAGLISGGASIVVDSDTVINALEKAIPGVIPQTVLEFARAALKAVGAPAVAAVEVAPSV